MRYPHILRQFYLGTIVLGLCAQLSTGETKPAPKPVPAPPKKEAPAAPAPQPQPVPAPQPGKTNPQAPDGGIKLTPEQQQRILEIGHHLRLGMDTVKNDPNLTEEQRIRMNLELIKAANKAIQANMPSTQKPSIKPPVKPSVNPKP